MSACNVLDGQFDQELLEAAFEVDQMSIEQFRAIEDEIFNKVKHATITRRYSPLARVGGKFYLANYIKTIIPPHYNYIEPFCGAAWVFFKKEPSKFEVLNDIDFDIWNFLNVCKNNLQELLREGRFYITSRVEFDINKDYKNTKERIKRAWQYLYVVKNAYGTNVIKNVPQLNMGYKYNGCIKRDKLPKNLYNILTVIKWAHDRLNKVLVENRDYKDIIPYYDGEMSFYYIDPPYYKAKTQYKEVSNDYNFFSDDEHYNLFNILKDIKGKFLLSMNDNEYYRDLYRDFYIQNINTRWALGERYKSSRKNEILVANYDFRQMDLLK